MQRGQGGARSCNVQQEQGLQYPDPIRQHGSKPIATACFQTMNLPPDQPDSPGLPPADARAAWQHPYFGPPGEGQAAWHQPPAPRRSPRGSAIAGWIGIVLGCAMMISMHLLSAALVQEDAPDNVGPLLMEIQGKYMVGTHNFMPGSSEMMYSQAEETLNLGSITQRHQFVVLAAELAGPDAALQVITDLDRLIADEQAKRQHEDGDQARPVMTDDQRAVHEILRFVYGTGTAPAPDATAEPVDEVVAGATSEEEASSTPDAAAVDADDSERWAQTLQRVGALTADQTKLLRDELGWFGKAAVAPPGTGRDVTRSKIEMSARIVLFTFLGAAGVLVVVGVAGLIGLVVLVILALQLRTRSGVQPGNVHHGLYAETFGIWMILFPLGQFGAGVVGALAPTFAMPAVLAVFFASLLVLFWPVLRGARWSDVRADVGLTLGRNPTAEPFIGVLGYAMGLPMLAVGLVLVFILIGVQAFFLPEQGVFDPAGGPAHPILLELGGPAIWPKVMILFLAAVAAPIVEETMFRGVLYRHLRDFSRRLGNFLSIVISALVSGFIFAAIHPQGWVAIPALMALSFAFVLVREWRGTLIPAMIVHGISNFLVMSLLIIVLSV